jgi:predicted metalloendopeptidase
MSVDELKHLLDDVPDSRELVLRRGERWSALHDAWREAHDEAVEAYAGWSTRRTTSAYVAYRAAQDRADAAQDSLAGVGG